MPFEELEVVFKYAGPPRAKLSYMRNARKGKGGEVNREKLKGKTPQLIVSLPTVVFLSKAKTFKLLLGSGNERNILRVKAGEGKNVAQAKDFKNHVILRFGYVPRFGDDIFDQMECNIERVDNDTYDIVLPATFFDKDDTVGKANAATTRMNAHQTIPANPRAAR